MALNRVGVSIAVTKNEACSGLFLEDTTGQYNAVTNPEGYGLPGGATSDNVTNVIVVLRYSTLGTYITYNFTVLLGVIQACTLAIEGGTPVDITAELPHTVWPFDSDHQFELTADYGVTIPTIGDGVYQVEYTIEGEAGAPAEAFSYTTSEQFVLDCEARCCIHKLYASLDPNCSCSDEKQKTADEAYTWLQTANYAAEYGDVDKAVDALKKAKELCDCNCKGC